MTERIIFPAQSEGQGGDDIQKTKKLTLYVKKKRGRGSNKISEFKMVMPEKNICFNDMDR